MPKKNIFEETPLIHMIIISTLALMQAMIMLILIMVAYESFTLKENPIFSTGDCRVVNGALAIKNNMRIVGLENRESKHLVAINRQDMVYDHSANLAIDGNVSLEDYLKITHSTLRYISSSKGKLLFENEQSIVARAYNRLFAYFYSISHNN